MLLKTSSGTADRRLVLAKSMRGDVDLVGCGDLVRAFSAGNSSFVSVMSLSEPSRFRKLVLIELRSFMVFVEDVVSEKRVVGMFLKGIFVRFAFALRLL